MIDHDTYLTSLEKLEKQEKDNFLSIEKGKNFLIDYHNSLKLSKEIHKNILICFYINRCDGCNVVKYLLNNDINIKNELSQYIVLFHNMNEIKTYLPNKYNIYIYPTLLVVDSNEKIIKQKNGVSVLGGAENNILNWLTMK